MKVLYLLDSLGRGGAEILALDVCRNAQASGLDLTFAAFGGGELEADFRRSGVDFIRLKRHLPVDLFLVAKLKKIIVEQEIKIVHANQAVEAIHAHLASFGTKAKIVLSHHGFVPDRKNLLALKFLIPRVAANVVVSRALHDWYKTGISLIFSGNTKVIYNGADAKRLMGNGENFRKELGLSADALLFGMIGNFYRDPRKDQMSVCQSLPRIFAKTTNTHCVFVGKTEEGAERKLQDCIDFCRENNLAERVHFLGARRDVPDVLHALDLFVLSSLHEGLPIAAIEAMLARVPLIVSDIEPLLEISQDGRYAEIFPVGNAEILSEKIIKLLKNENQREDLAKAAFEYAAKNFSIEAHIENLIKLYDSIL
jgi:glycosyltransferase involved in cell wall biosynthesis